MTNVVGETFLTLKDKFAQTVNGEITSAIIDLLVSSNEVLEDAVATECNSGTVNITAVRNRLPDAQFRQYYQGVNCSAGRYTQVQDATGMLETYSQIDKDLVDKSKNPAQFRTNESQAHLNGMNETFLENLIYGSKDYNPAGFDGFARRYNVANNSPTAKGLPSRCISAGGTGDNNTSIYLITWGSMHTSLLYPEGSKAGIQHQDLGEVTAQDDNNRMYQAYRDHYKWDVGLCVRDFRTVIRICNIDTEALLNGTGPDITKLMLSAYYKVRPYAKTGKPVFYANDLVRNCFHQQIIDKKNVSLTVDNYAGKPVLNMLGIPIKSIDQIVNNEQHVFTIGVDDVASSTTPTIPTQATEPTTPTEPTAETEATQPTDPTEPTQPEG